MTICRSQESGISLLETMVALVIMSFMAIMIASSFGFQGRALQRVTGNDLKLEMVLNRHQLQSWIEGIPKGTSQGKPLKFEGRPDALLFETIDSSGRFWPGAPVLIEVRKFGNMLAIQANGKAEPSTPLELSLPLSTSLTPMVKFRYFGEHGSGEGVSWGERWDRAPRLPELIRLDWSSDMGPEVPLVFEPALKERLELRELNNLLPQR